MNYLFKFWNYMSSHPAYYAVILFLSAILFSIFFVYRKLRSLFIFTADCAVKEIAKFTETTEKNEVFINSVPCSSYKPLQLTLHNYNSNKSYTFLIPYPERKFCVINSEKVWSIDRITEFEPEDPEGKLKYCWYERPELTQEIFHVAAVINLEKLISFVNKYGEKTQNNPETKK